MTKILCIDDSPTIQAIVAAVLRQAGMEVVAASSGEEGLDLMRRELPDAVLLDMQMPGMDGLELLQHVSQDAQLSRIPIMFMTADEHDETASKARSLGAREVVVKPLQVTTLRSLVARLLEQS
jgi:two-component system NtrC family response regulator/two-component system nitrogen regulation response regulator GlnG